MISIRDYLVYISTIILIYSCSTLCICLLLLPVSALAHLITTDHYTLAIATPVQFDRISINFSMSVVSLSIGFSP